MRRPVRLSNVVDLWVYQYELAAGASKREAALTATVAMSSLPAYQGVDKLTKQMRLDLRITRGGGRVRD